MNTIGQSKKEAYEDLLKQAAALLGSEQRPLPCMSNICALLKERFGFFWVGFYIVDGDDLILGPFQGPVACITIGPGRGVCGAARERRETVIVPDVDKFPGHIACNARSRSEIVVPLIADGEVVAVLDIDSDCLDSFDRTDAEYLGKLLDFPLVKRIGELYK